jgi:hypothetical protein
MQYTLHSVGIQLQYFQPWYQLRFAACCEIPDAKYRLFSFAAGFQRCPCGEDACCEDTANRNDRMQATAPRVTILYSCAGREGEAAKMLL